MPRIHVPLRAGLLAYLILTFCLAMAILVSGPKSFALSITLFSLSLVGIYVFCEMDKLQRAHDAKDTIIDAQKATINSAYYERNVHVALLARLYPSGIRPTTIENWDPEWQNCVYIDLPAGQISYHYHISEAHLFHDLPPYTKPWDGHQKDEVHARLMSPGTFTGLLPTAWLDYWIARSLANWEETGGFGFAQQTPPDVYRALNDELIDYLANRVFTMRRPEVDWVEALKAQHARLQELGKPLTV